MNSTRSLLFGSGLNRLFSFRAFHALLLTLSGLMVLFFVLQAVRFLPVISDNVYPESAGALAAHRWAQGLPLYEDYRQPPYLMTSFTPFWYAIVATAAKAGLSDLDSLVLFGRLLSLASLFGMALLAYRWNRRLGFSPLLSLLAPAFLLSFPILIPWAVTARPDFPALFLALFALYWAAFRPSAAALSVAAVAAALAFLAKQNTLAVPIVLVLWMLWSKRWKHALLFCAVWTIVVVAVMSPFYISSRDALLLNLSGGKFGFFALTYVRDVLNRLFARPGAGLAVILFALGTFGLLQSLKIKDARFRLVGIYFVAALGLAVVGSAAAGGGVNHYFEPTFAMALLIPVGMARLQETWQDASPSALFATIMVLALVLPSLDVQRWNAMHRKPEDLRPFVSLMANRRAFSDDSYLAARTATPAAVDLSSLTNSLKRGGWAAWSSAAMAEDLQKAKYELLILRTKPLARPYDLGRRYPRTHRLDARIQMTVAENYTFCLASVESTEYGQLHVYSPHPFSAELCPLLKTALPKWQNTSTIALNE